MRNYTFRALIHLWRTWRKWSWRKSWLPSAPPLKIRGPIDPLIRLARCHADTQENTTSETNENWPGPLVFTLQQEAAAAAAYICPLRAWGRIISLQRWRDRCRVNWQLLHRWVLGKRFFFFFFTAMKQKALEMTMWKVPLEDSVSVSSYCGDFLLIAHDLTM